MASLEELKEALLHTLAAKGSLGPLKARLRSEIFTALDQGDDNSTPKPPLSNTNLLINELIRDYLQFNHYRYTLNVFLPESNQPEQPPFEREFMSRELHVQENQHSVQIPLLYSIVALLQQGKVADSSAGVAMTEGVPAAAAASSSSSAVPQPSPLQQAAFQPAPYSSASAASTSAPAPSHSYVRGPYQPSASSTHRGAEEHESGVSLGDAPKPLQFTNRY